MLALPQPTFPNNTKGAIAWFWLKYWLWFLLLLPFMIVRQVFLTAWQLTGAVWTWNRRYQFLDGRLEVFHMNSVGSTLATALFNERFLGIRYADVLVDPGPLFGRNVVKAYIDDAKTITAIVATHGHEEHIGNAFYVSSLTGIPIRGTTQTIAQIRDPEQLSFGRKTLMGQPLAADAKVAELVDPLVTDAITLAVVPSEGHCKGHASLYDSGTGVLLAGDSFLHTVFTAPNKDVSSADWIDTLERYGELDVRTMVGTHGCIFSDDPRIPVLPFVVERRSPNAMIADKLRFIRWARDLVAEGERRELPYSVIEACLFPWQRRWTWGNWFSDESWRLFSAGEFSRTQFVRSLSAHPERVPYRFPVFERQRQRFFGSGGSNT